MIEIQPIGQVRGGRDEAVDDDWGQSLARIELDPARFGPEALAGLSDFSHLEVIFVFDRVPDDKIEYGARHPRGRADWPLVGIFAQRGKNRPNRLGLCTCRIVQVEGLAVEVEGLDAINGTPVVDLKPAMREFLPRGEVIEPAWAAELMREYW
jgi:tRNA (adenine37-N6)-methyltransferase